MSPLGIFNAVEAGWWMLCAGMTTAYGHRVRGLAVRERIVLTLLFLAFGMTDLIEISTGAWWRPRGLMIANMACVGGIVAIGAVVLRRRRG